MNEQGTESVMNFYRPQTKLREGNVLHVFVRPWRGGGVIVPSHNAPLTIPPGTLLPPPRTTKAGGTHAAEMLSCLILKIKMYL